MEKKDVEQKRSSMKSRRLRGRLKKNISNEVPEEKALKVTKEELIKITKEFVEAVKNGNTEIVKRIVKDKKVSLNTRDVSDDLMPTVLHVACMQNQEEIVKILLEDGENRADPNLPNKDDEHPLWIATKHGFEEVVTALLKARADPNVLNIFTGTTPLYIAVLYGHTDICTRLIHAGADINLRRMIKGFPAESPLMKAIQMNNPEIVSLLLRSLCQVNAQTNTGLTALHYAIAYCRYEMAEELLQNGAKASRCTTSGISSLALAIERDDPLMCNILINHGANIRRKYKWGETPLMQALRMGCETCAIILVLAGVSLKRSSSKSSYLLLAARMGMTRLIRLLVDMEPIKLNESWIKKRRWPTALLVEPDTQDLLATESNQVPSLQQQVRASIRRVVGCHPRFRLAELNLPPKILDYICLKNHEPCAKFMRRRTMEDICPLACPPTCQEDDCFELDIESDSSD